MIANIRFTRSLFFYFVRTDSNIIIGDEQLYWLSHTYDLQCVSAFVYIGHDVTIHSFYENNSGLFDSDLFFSQGAIGFI